MSLCWHVKLWMWHARSTDCIFVLRAKYGGCLLCVPEPEANWSRCTSNSGTNLIFWVAISRVSGYVPSQKWSPVPRLSSLNPWGGGNEKRLCGSLLTHLPFLDGCHGCCSLAREWSSWGCLWAGRYRESMGSLSERKWDEKKGIVTEGERVERGTDWGKIICWWD